MTFKSLILGVCSAAVIAACSGDKTETSPAATDTAAMTEAAGSEAASKPSKPAPKKNVEGKIIIASEADVPRVTFMLDSKPSELALNGGAEYEALRAEVSAHVDTLLADYDIQDKTTHKQYLGLKKAMLILDGKLEESLTLTADIKALEDKPAAKATTGLTTDAYTRAMMATADQNSDEFKTAYRAELRAALETVDPVLVRDTMESLVGQMRMMTPKLLESALKSQFDALAEGMDNNVDLSIAAAVVSIPLTVQRMAHSDILIEEVEAMLASVETAPKQDLWSERGITVTEGTPVVLAVWDTGVDPDIMGDTMWTNPEAGKRGNAHGLAFAKDFTPETEELLPEANDYKDDMADLMDLMKGSLDLSAGLNSDEAKLLASHLGNIEPDELDEFQKQMAVLGNYIHGQHVADITADGNAQAQIMNIRMSWPSDPIPTEPFDEKFARALVKASKDSVAFMRDNNVRVVNMSWRITRPAIEGSLMVTGAEPDADKRQTRAAAIFEIMRSGLEEAFASAPEILFVAGAGNEDEDVEFVQSVPAGINLPNVITVGAVDSELKPAGFTSFGKSIDIYANGFEIPARVPGSREMKLSGTSMAAPMVANIAGKLWAKNPDLTVVQVRKALEDTATLEGDLRVVHAGNAMQSVQ